MPRNVVAALQPLEHFVNLRCLSNRRLKLILSHGRIFCLPMLKNGGVIAPLLRPVPLPMPRLTLNVGVVIVLWPKLQVFIETEIITKHCLNQALSIAQRTSLFLWFLFLQQLHPVRQLGVAPRMYSRSHKNRPLSDTTACSCSAVNKHETIANASFSCSVLHSTPHYWMVQVHVQNC